MNGNGEPGPAGAEKINTDIVTLTRFLTEEQVKHKEATGDFTYVLDQALGDASSSSACPTVYYAMRSNLHSKAYLTTSEGRHLLMYVGNSHG